MSDNTSGIKLDSAGMGKVYDDFADAFAKSDQLPTWRYAGKPAMERVLEGCLNENAKLLDLGSASARVEVNVLLPHGVKPENITGIEISPDQVEIAKKRIAGANFFVGDISDPSLLSGKDGTFDAVFSHMVFEHLDDEQFKRTCENASRLLKPGGMFAFVVTHPDKMTDVAGNLVTNYGAFETSAPWGGVLHNWRRSVADTVKTLEGSGFADVTTEDIPFPSEMPDGLSAEEQASFSEALEKYSRYPAIRLAVRARKQ